ncbi:MAG: phage shock protein operon transcriptional activator [Gammaproteobacteria bacterium]|nr:phage shock protein operon transcriptional activator [Gammaproteobacteria bacterium]NNF48774.1 phage shock protein operon transcriptional activator [Woeseiaceae bacterium]MBT8094619.1 phage shock protein operon transcriptional activator [Gammaproteobacteria bacterium]MBT8106384.1 phage shock protein operon transcriptional activator [Gammaproteobacteria bacterium]NNK26399.1 phage shock protein operon transcriptional activator [Woeseiaceae bacterium]
MAVSPESQPIIGEAPAFLEMLEHVSRAAPLSKPVLVVGERGTGKELIASRLHFLSERWEQPVVKVNCAALTESILESELFGHEAGAFTGAARTHIGHFERADGGTLILDELATISLRMQEKILRTIEYGEIQRVGGNEILRVDVRIVGSTNADLQALAVDGRFRNDLLDRLAFDVITVPPLRERVEDILPLAHAFAINMASELHWSLFPGFSARATSALLRHDWPGNVRELKFAVERSVYRAMSAEKPMADIVFDAFDSPYKLAAPAGVSQPRPRRRKAPLLPTDLKQRLIDTEVDLIEAALEKARFNQRMAADLLGLSYHQFRGKLRKFDIRSKPGQA